MVVGIAEGEVSDSTVPKFAIAVGELAASDWGSRSSVIVEEKRCTEIRCIEIRCMETDCKPSQLLASKLVAAMLEYADAEHEVQRC